MHGIRCGNCDGQTGAQAYITAYDIAVKHGYQGTEEDWVNTLQSVYVAKVVDYGPYEWDCSDKFADLVEKSAYTELHLTTQDGRTAFLNGMTDHMLVFDTLPFMHSEYGRVYLHYELYASDYGTYLYADAVSPGQNAVEYSMLENSVQESLDKADTAYQKPAGGIPYSDLKTDLVSDINKAPIIYIRLVDTDVGVAVDLEHTDFHGYTSPQEAIADGADVRIAHTDTRLTGSPYITHPFIGALNGALAFGGLELYLDDGYAFGFGWYIIYDVGGTISVEKFYDTSMDLFVADEPQLEP